jgi:hypothetical protein
MIGNSLTELKKPSSGWLTANGEVEWLGPVLFGLVPVISTNGDNPLGIVCRHPRALDAHGIGSAGCCFIRHYAKRT